MAIRLDNLVVDGEISNTKKYSVCGCLGLKGKELPLVLDLTGDCEPDLRGRRFRFEARPDPDQDRDDLDTPPSDDANLSGLAWRQVGPTGVMTAARTRDSAGGSSDSSVGCLYLEWWGQNGRVTVELVDPIIEFIEADEEEALKPEREHERDLDLTEDDEDVPFETWTDGFEEEDEDEDAYGLIPEELQRQLDGEARQTDLSIQAEDDESDVIRELELMDDLIERGEGDPIGTILEETVKLPPADSLDDEQAERELKKLLALLARYNIALAICEHFTPRDAYRLLLEHILLEETAHPELRATQWVQHFMTAEYCKECEAEMEREFREHLNDEPGFRDGNPADGSASDEDDDVPF